MASGFPGSIDNFTDPLSNSSLSSPSHAGQHADLNDAVEKIETYMGLVKVIPTSISSAGGTAATLAANGTINIGTGNTSIQINGAFSSLYDVYRIVINGGVSSALCSLDFSFVGVTTGYYGGWVGTKFDTSAVVGLGLNNAARWSYAGWSNTAGQFMDLTVFAANQALRKYCQTGGYVNSTGSYGTFVGEVVDTSARTGFVITPSTGTITGGNIRVYGYRN